MHARQPVEPRRLEERRGGAQQFRTGRSRYLAHDLVTHGGECIVAAPGRGRVRRVTESRSGVISVQLMSPTNGATVTAATTQA